MRTFREARQTHAAVENLAVELEEGGLVARGGRAVLEERDKKREKIGRGRGNVARRARRRA